jgi:hypothetical protein
MSKIFRSNSSPTGGDVVIEGCEYPLVIILDTHRLWGGGEAVPKWQFSGIEVYPLPTLPLRCLAGRGFRKNGLQILDVKELTGHNLEYKGVRSAVMSAACAASALTILS